MSIAALCSVLIYLCFVVGVAFLLFLLLLLSLFFHHHIPGLSSAFVMCSRDIVLCSRVVLL